MDFGVSSFNSISSKLVRNLIFASTGHLRRDEMKMSVFLGK